MVVELRKPFIVVVLLVAFLYIRLFSEIQIKYLL